MSKTQFQIPANTQVQQPFYTPATTPTPQFVDWKAQKTASELSEAWNSLNLQRLAEGKPAVMLPNLSQEELAELVKKIMG